MEAEIKISASSANAKDSLTKHLTPPLYLYL